ncbi:cyclopropane-fatty-acyl-phospholipid synthase [Sphaerotilus hippei]|uniref:Cyclopropane-fatty-acyl-phospholipid synthase n=1 Tax=Sphaerotilus hippei TaxID=744406 RepID=A0A318H6W1_9BURK|nr:cyclopropane-fatty-acyl-phospholipid synthase [Sphaerotilus hippei]
MGKPLQQATPGQRDPPRTGDARPVTHPVLVRPGQARPAEAVEATPLRTLHTRLAGRIEAMLDRLPCTLAVRWPGGRLGGSMADVRLTLHDRHLLMPLVRGDIGQVADAYVRGAIDMVGAPRDVMAVAAALVGDPVERGRTGTWSGWLAHWRSRWQHHRQRDARNVRFHYDVSDAFFSLWLDPLRVYSCAYFEDPAMTLAQAQQAKLEHVCRKLQLRPGQRLLDVGAGWGGLLLWAAEHHGVRALGITLSQNQHAHATALIAARGLQDRVEMRLMDYRDLPQTGEFDAVASVGMFEHVGRARLGGYFSTLARLVRPGGLVLNHGITASSLRHTQLGGGLGDFIDEHIFPGGELSHVVVVARHLSASGLELLDAENLRPHYARTLWAWSDALERQLDAARATAGDTTLRAYRMYLPGRLRDGLRAGLAVALPAAGRAARRTARARTAARRPERLPVQPPPHVRLKVPAKKRSVRCAARRT